MEMSALLSAIGLVYSYLVWSRTPYKYSAYVVLFFTSMEVLQTVQYMFIAPSLDSPICDTPINKILTLLGVIHICIQPYVANIAASALVTDEKERERYVVVKRLCLLGAVMLFSRLPLSYVWEQTLIGPSSEWLRGDKLCTFQGTYHLAWSVPMADPSYFMPGISLHFFLMFAPSIVLYENRTRFLRTFFIIATGPVLAGLITPNLMEQASIWCFLAIAQISIMQFTLRKIIWAKYYDAKKAPSPITTRKGKSA